jgi:hypothetical protein
LHDPKSSKYGIYYSMILVSVSIMLILEEFGLVRFSLIQHMGTYFEGFAALYMLSRHDIGKTFLLNLSRMKLVQRL